MAYLWRVCYAKVLILRDIRIGIQSVVNAYTFSGPQNASQFISTSYINIRLIMLSQVPLLQIGSPIRVIRARPRVSSSLSRCVAYTSTMVYCPLYAIQYVLKSPRTIISPFTILIVYYSSPYVVIWGLLPFRLQMLSILIQPLSIANYNLAILGLMLQQLYAYILIYQLIRKYIRVAKSSLYRLQYPFS